MLTTRAQRRHFIGGVADQARGHLFPVAQAPSGVPGPVLRTAPGELAKIALRSRGAAYRAHAAKASVQGWPAAPCPRRGVGRQPRGSSRPAHRAPGVFARDADHVEPVSAARCTTSLQQDTKALAASWKYLQKPSWRGVGETQRHQFNAGSRRLAFRSSGGAPGSQQQVQRALGN